MGFFDGPLQQSTGSSGNFFTSSSPGQISSPQFPTPMSVAPMSGSTPMVAPGGGSGDFLGGVKNFFTSTIPNAAKAAGGFVGDFAKTLFSGDENNPTGNKPLPSSASSFGGIAANAFLGIPDATVKVGQDILANTLGKLGVSIAQDIETLVHPDNKAALDSVTFSGPFSALLGDRPISGFSTDVADLEQTIKNNPIAQQWGLSKFALPLAFGGVVGENALNFTPFGEESGALKALARSTDLAETSGILRQIGVAEDLIPQVAPKFVEMTKEADVKAGLDMVQNLQKTTKVADAFGEFKTEADPEPTRATPAAQPTLGLDGETPKASKDLGLSPIQDTISKVDLTVKGEGTGTRVTSAIANSESLRTQITNFGQEAFVAGRGLSQQDLSIIRDAYQSGKTIAEVVAQTSNPAKAGDFLTKLQHYYDFQLAADRAAGGTTARVQNYVPQIWDLSKPADLAKFNQYAAQKGIKPYDGFSAQPRVFSSYAEGEAAGFKPKNQSILEDLKDTFGSAANGISRQALKKGLLDAAPNFLSVAGRGVTDGGKPFINSNIPGLEGISYHPAVAKMLKGYEPLRSPDFIAMAKKIGAEAAAKKKGLDKWITQAVATAKAAPGTAKEAGFVGSLGSIYDHVSAPMKQVLWNWSGFHSLNITLNHISASSLNPVTGTKGVIQSIASFVSERAYSAVIDSYKNMVIKDSAGAETSVFDWAVKSGAFESRHLPATGAARFSPLKAGQRAIFDREIPVLQLNLAEQAAKKGIIADSPQGRAVGREIRAITGEINTKTMQLNPNSVKYASRALLAPGFTFSKYKTLGDAVVGLAQDARIIKAGEEGMAAKRLAQKAVLGKSMIVGTVATLGTLLATGKFPNLLQLLLNYTVNPSTQTNLTNPKGQKLDITYPKTFLSEGASAMLNPIQYGNARLNPIIADVWKYLNNSDYYGRKVVDPNVPEPASLQVAKNIGIGHLPIGAQAVINMLMGKQTGTQAGIAIGGLGTRVSADDPSKVKYAGIDKAAADIGAIAPDDPDRLAKMQAIFNSIPPADRSSLQYRELMGGVSTKGVYISATEQKYFQVQDLLAKGDTAGATAITQAMDKKEYSTYKSIKTHLANVKLFTQVQDLMTKGDTDGAAKLTQGMSKEQYKSYQSWKKNNAKK